MLRTKIPSLLARLAWALAYLLFVAGYAPQLAAQTPTPEQIEIFKSLPPDQQQAILDTFTKGGQSGSQPTAERPTDAVQPIVPRVPPKTSLQPADMTGPPRLKAGDTLLLKLEIRRFERPAADKEPTPSVDRRAQQQQAIPGSSGSVVTQPLPGASETPQVPVQRSEEDTERLQTFRTQILRRNPYRLDESGMLNVSELGPIQLGGLSVDEATERLAAEERLGDFVVQLTYLPLEPTGGEALKPFGYDLFAGAPSTFAPATDVPVPLDYSVGPGDTIEVQLIGNTRGFYPLLVGRDGRINFPELGPIAVAGRRFEDVRRDLAARVSAQMIGTQASVSIGELRSIRIFVLGDAQVPGSYTVSGLSTITNALFVSGGVTPIGSLRNIELKRNGRTVSTLDLYDLLLNGDTSGDARLLPGDVIFVPPVRTTVGVAGQIRRPALYELRGEATVADLIKLGGGLTPTADPGLATLERVDEQRSRITLDINLAAAGGSERLHAGDVLRIPGIRPVLDNSIALEGHLYRPGTYQFRAGMRLTDVLRSPEELKPNADQHYILIRRETAPGRRIVVFSADLTRALADPGSAANFELAPRDRIHVFDMESGRDRIIEPLMRELRMQADAARPTPQVQVSGKIKVPGRYPLEPGMRVSDLLRAGGSLDEAAYGAQAELTRYEVANGEQRRAQLVGIDLRGVLAGDPAADLPLQPFDYLVIKETPLWESQEVVDVQGEVRFPGRYPIHRGETLRSVMERAGGLTDLAFVGGAVFTRVELKERERKQLTTLANRMESDIAQMSLMTAQEAGIRDAGQSLAVGRSLLTSLREAQPIGRLVIDLNRVANASPGSEQDIVLKDGDRLLVPRVAQEVTVIGEVQSPTSHLFRTDLNRDDYIALSGGLTPRADDDRIYVVRADGSVVARSGSWFGGGVDIRYGDTIVAPLDTERMRPLPFWQAVTSIVYNLAISAAAVNSF